MSVCESVSGRLAQYSLEGLKPALNLAFWASCGSGGQEVVPLPEVGGS